MILIDFVSTITQVIKLFYFILKYEDQERSGLLLGKGIAGPEEIM